MPAISEIRPDLDVDATDWFGAVMRGGTPAEVIAAMNGAVGRVLEREDVRAALMAEGVLPHPDPSAADVQAFRTQELPVRRRLVEGVTAQLDGSRRPGIDPLPRTDDPAARDAGGEAVDQASIPAAGSQRARIDIWLAALNG